MTGQSLAELGRSSLEAIKSVGLPIVIALGIASAQITLLFRGDHVPTGIAASLVWMAGAVLLSDVREQGASGGARRGRRGCAGSACWPWGGV